MCDSYQRNATLVVGDSMTVELRFDEFPTNTLLATDVTRFAYPGAPVGNGRFAFNYTLPSPFPSVWADNSTRPAARNDNSQTVMTLRVRRWRAAGRCGWPRSHPKA